MIETIRLIRNLGLFDSVSATNIRLSRLTLVYAENGRGKTTLSTVLRSLSSGDPLPLRERARLSGSGSPSVVLDCGGATAIFQDNAWNQIFPDIAIFDDVFVDENVCSGLTIQSTHRQKLHELILGARGVNLNRQLQALISTVEEHNVALRLKGAAVTIEQRGPFSVDEFCSLQPDTNIDEAIQEVEQRLAAVRKQNEIRLYPSLDLLRLPNFDVGGINETLQEGLPSGNAAAFNQVKAHINRLGQDGEKWLAEGMGLLGNLSDTACPFCNVDLSVSRVFPQFQSYFSDAYTELTEKTSNLLTTLNQTHGGEAIALFERSFASIVQKLQFWSEFCKIPDSSIDSAQIAVSWQNAREAVFQEISDKQSSPLEPRELSDATLEAVNNYMVQCRSVERFNDVLEQANQAIRIVREHAANANTESLEADLRRLTAIKRRQLDGVALICENYVLEKNAKTQTEQERDRVRGELEAYRSTVLPSYETAINLYLQRFNAGFRLANVSSANTRSGSVCNYNVIINNTPIPIAGGPDITGEASFRNTLSAGDRSTLALAFFFASLDQNSSLSDSVVLIDDPFSSLDEHRTLATIQEIRRLVQRANQVLVLSHSKAFLCQLWESADASMRSAIELTRDQSGSAIRLWNVDNDSVTEYDRRHALLRQYLAFGSSNPRAVAEAIRPLLEGFFRVACPEFFPSGTLLGQFINLSEQRIGGVNQILDLQKLNNLRDIVEYANRFHHDTNPAWATELINDGELRGFATLALNFVNSATS